MWKGIKFNRDLRYWYRLCLAKQTTSFTLPCSTDNKQSLRYHCQSFALLLLDLDCVVWRSCTVVCTAWRSLVWTTITWSDCVLHVIVASLDWNAYVLCILACHWWDAYTIRFNLGIHFKFRFNIDVVHVEDWISLHLDLDRSFDHPLMSFIIGGRCSRTWCLLQLIVYVLSVLFIGLYLIACDVVLMTSLSRVVFFFLRVGLVIETDEIVLRRIRLVSD